MRLPASSPTAPKARSPRRISVSGSSRPPRRSRARRRSSRCAGAGSSRRRLLRRSPPPARPSGLGLWANSLRDTQPRVVAMDGGGSLVVEGDEATLVACLDDPPAGKAYEAWVIEDDRPRPAGPLRRRLPPRPARRVGRAGEHRRRHARGRCGLRPADERHPDERQMSDYAVTLSPAVGRQESDAAREPSDEQVLEAVGRGDDDALGVLYDRFGRARLPTRLPDPARPRARRGRGPGSLSRRLALGRCLQARAGEAVDLDPHRRAPAGRRPRAPGAEPARRATGSRSRAVRRPGRRGCGARETGAPRCRRR